MTAPRLLALTLAAALPAQGAEPPTPHRLLAGGRPIEVDGGHAAPAWFDWDGDGLEDLLVGQQAGGRLRIYRNTGRKGEPRFDGFAWFEVGGRPAEVPAGAEGFGPQLADLNGDGAPDVLSGSASKGTIWWFERRSSGTFAERKPLLTSEGRPLTVGRDRDPGGSAVAAWDADRDGDVDLVMGGVDGRVWLARNVGDAKEPRFAPPSRLETAAGAPIRVAGCAAPCVADWNVDGWPDLLLGAADGSVVWHRNDGGEGLAAAEVLLPASRTTTGEGFLFAAWDTGVPWGTHTRVAVADVDGDGRPDLLVCDRRSMLAPDARPAEPGARARASAEWRTAFERLAALGRERSELRAQPADAARDERLAEIEKDIAETEKSLGGALKGTLGSHTNEHGRVWIFARRKWTSAPAK